MKSINQATKEMIWAEVVKQPKITKAELITLHSLFEKCECELVGYEMPDENGP